MHQGFSTCVCTNYSISQRKKKRKKKQKQVQQCNIQVMKSKKNKQTNKKHLQYCFFSPFVKTDTQEDLSICPIILRTVGAPHDVTTSLRHSSLSSAFLTVSLSPKSQEEEFLKQSIPFYHATYFALIPLPLSTYSNSPYPQCHIKLLHQSS